MSNISKIIWIVKKTTNTTNDIVNPKTMVKSNN